LYAAKRPLLQPVIFFVIVASVVLAACGSRLPNQNWPGLTADGDRVYVAYGAGVAAVDIVERRLLWTFPERIVFGDFGASQGFFSPGRTVTVYALENDPGASAPGILWTRDDIAHDRIIASPAQASSQVFVGTADNRVYALDASTGELQWEFQTEHSIWAQPLYHDEVVYAASLDDTLYALNAETGDELWRATFAGSIASQPALTEGILYVPSFDRQLHALAADSGEELWAADAANWVWGSPTVGNGTVFFGDISGNIFALDAETGETVWEAKAAGAIQNSPLYADGALFVASGETGGEEEEIIRGQLLALDASDGSELWRRETAGPVFTRPVLVNGSVVVTVLDEGVPTLVVYDSEDGDQVWDFSLPSE
jgi:outer membrane protein assembly factor BamB